MSIHFYVDPKLTKKVKTIALGYNFFNLDRKVAQTKEKERTTKL